MAGCSSVQPKGPYRTYVMSLSSTVGNGVSFWSLRLYYPKSGYGAAGEGANPVGNVGTGVGAGVGGGRDVGRWWGRCRCRCRSLRLLRHQVTSSTTRNSRMTSVVAVVQLSNRNRRCCGSSPNTTSSNHNNGEQDTDKHGIYKGFYGVLQF